jgi:hypothetical protein
MLEDPLKMSAETAMDEVTDLIANIEMHRQEIERETGLEASRSYALGRLRLDLRHRQEESQLHGPDAARLANTEALAVEIRRVESLAASASRRQTPARAFAGPHRQSRRDMPRQSPGSRGRRTMGRRTSR